MPKIARRPKGTELPPDATLLLVLEAAGAIQARAEAALLAVGLSFAEYRILRQLGESGVALGDEGDLLELVARGLLRTREGPGRGDRVSCALTLAGRAKAAQGARVLEAVGARVVAALGGEGGARLRQLLAKVSRPADSALTCS